MDKTAFTQREIQSIAQAASMINNAIHLNFTLEVLSTTAGISPTKLKAGFLYLYLVSPYLFAKHLRIERTKVLLYIEKMPLEKIIAYVGYQKVTTLRKDFTILVGYTPEDWMEHLSA
jgi:AraC-like DNA-binding protein